MDSNMEWFLYFYSRASYFCTYGCLLIFADLTHQKKHEVHEHYGRTSKFLCAECEVDGFVDQKTAEKHSQEAHAETSHPTIDISHDPHGDFWCGICRGAVSNPILQSFDGAARINYRYNHFREHGTHMNPKHWYGVTDRCDTFYDKLAQKPNLYLCHDLNIGLVRLTAPVEQTRRVDDYLDRLYMLKNQITRRPSAARCIRLAADLELPLSVLSEYRIFGWLLHPEIHAGQTSYRCGLTKGSVAPLRAVPRERQGLYQIFLRQGGGTIFDPSENKKLASVYEDSPEDEFNDILIKAYGHSAKIDMKNPEIFHIIDLDVVLRIELLVEG